MYKQVGLGQPEISSWLPQPKSFEVPVFVHQIDSKILKHQLESMVKASELAIKAATTVLVDGKPVTRDNLSIRNCYTLPASVITQGTESLFESVAKSAWGNFGFSSNEPSGGQWQFLMYKPGGFFVTHYDDSRGHMMGGKNYVYRNTPERSMTLLMYLNDDYEGGEIEFPNIRSENGAPLKIKPVAGTAIAFPSHELYAHRVLPTTSGTRYVVSRWFDDTSFFKVVEPCSGHNLLNLDDSNKIQVVVVDGEIITSNSNVTEAWGTLMKNGICHNHMLVSAEVKTLSKFQVLGNKREFETSILLSQIPTRVFSSGIGGHTNVETLKQFGAVQHRLDTFISSTNKDSLVLSFKSVRAYELSPEFRPISLLQ